jgi:hypothetical protein
MKVILPNEVPQDFSQAKAGDVFIMEYPHGGSDSRLITYNSSTGFYYALDMKDGQTTLAAHSAEDLLEKYTSEKITLIPSEKVQVSFL